MEFEKIKSERRKREMALYPEWIELIKKSTERFEMWIKNQQY